MSVPPLNPIAPGGKRPARPAVASPRSTTERLYRIGLNLVVLGFGALFLLPFYWLIITSLKDLAAATATPPIWIPESIHFENYAEATTRIPFWRYTWNTLFVCVAAVIGTTVSSALVAWGFSQFEFKGRELFFGLTLATMMVPFPVLMVPHYAIFRELGWIGTLYPLWVPAFFGAAYNIFLLRQFFRTLPRELMEAARIDGCGEIRIFLTIGLPLSRSVIMVVALFAFLYNWNDFMAPLIYVTDESQFTLALGLQSFQSRLGGVEINLMMAATALMILPVLVIFFCMQKTFVEGISLSGIKG